jgi:hypothetical protein
MEEIERATPAAAGHSPRVSDQLDGSINPEFTVRHPFAQAGDPVTVIISGAAVAKGRPRVVRKTSVAFTPAHVRAYESHARLAAQLAMGGRCRARIRQRRTGKWVRPLARGKVAP